MPDSNKPSRNKSPRGLLVKLTLIILLLGSPLLVMLIFFRAPDPEVLQQEVLAQYDLPDGYTSQDIKNILPRMRQDKEFLFYYQTLSPDQIDQAQNMVIDILVQHRSQPALKKQMDALYDRISSVSTLFYNMDVPQDFDRRPEQYPELSNFMWNFLFQEFKLTILGVIYKANYDKDFRFRWNDTSRSSAQKLHGIVVKTNRLDYFRSLPVNRS